MPYKKVQIIINPAAGGDEPILNTLNDVFREHEIDWQVSITHQAGDGTRFAKQAAEAGADLVMAYGGDGTQLEVVAGLLGTDTPMASLPGGTANALIDDLGIPTTLREAAELVVAPDAFLRPIDVGQIGERYFLLRVGTGMVAKFSTAVNREMKDRYGLLAYFIGGLQAIRNPERKRYTLTLDGVKEEIEGIACLVTNASATGGASGVRIAKSVLLDDGLLDVYIVRGEGSWWLDVARSVMQAREDSMQDMLHWQVREVTIEMNSPEGLYADGEEEPFAEAPATIRVLHHAIRILVPAESNNNGADA